MVVWQNRALMVVAMVVAMLVLHVLPICMWFVYVVSVSCISCIRYWMSLNPPLGINKVSIYLSICYPLFSAWVYLSLPSSSHLIIFHPTVHLFTGYTSPLHRLYYLYHFALSSHTQAQVLNPCTIHTSTWTLSLCTLCTTFLVDINTDTINAHCNICIISVYTPLPVNMFSLCVLFFYCDSTVICVCMFVS